MRAAGHDDLRTTQRYINEAQTFDLEGFGTPFPAIPLGRFSDLEGFGPDCGQASGFLASENPRSGQKQGDSWRPQRDSNPR
jgi:hypothetical protein